MWNYRTGYVSPGRTTIFLVILILPLTTLSCTRGENPEVVAAQLTGGDPERGKRALYQYGCTACHSIPGIRTASGRVGPPLDGIATRFYLAGILPNTPENLVLWIRFPRQVSQETLMPDTGVTLEDGNDIAAYLYTLKP